MKKIIRGVLLGLLAVVVIGGVSVWFLLFHSKKPEINTQAYVVDNEGSSYLAVVNQEGTTYAAVTDNEGNIYAAEIKENGEIGDTIGKINDEVEIKDLPTNYTGEHISGEAVDINAFTGEASEVNPQKPGNTQPSATDITGVTQQSDPQSPSQQSPSQQTPSQQTPSQQTPSQQTPSQQTPSQQTPSQQTPSATQGDNSTPTAPSVTPSGGNTPSPSVDPTPVTQPIVDPTPKTLHLSKYQEMFKNGTYLMEFKTSDESLGDTPITAASKNGNVIIDTKIESYNCKMLYLAKDKTTYLIIDDFKKYCKLPEDLMGEEELDMSSMMSSIGQSIDLSKVESSTVTIGGQQLDVETITEGDTKTSYYFSGDTLVRIDSTSNGQTDSTYISRITSDVPDSMFEIPKNYGYLNLSWLNALS